MSERNDASRLNQQWDDHVQTPRAARKQRPSSDETINRLHSMDTPEAPDPGFRAQLQQQLQREGAYRSGQHRAGLTQGRPLETPTASAPNRFGRILEVVAVAAIVLLVGTALIWAIQIRGGETPDSTPTFELAATTSNLVDVSPESTATATATPTEEPAPPTETPEPAPTETVAASATSEPPTPTSTPPPTTDPTDEATPSATSDSDTSNSAIAADATSESDRCADMPDLLVAVTSTLALTELPPELRGSFPATSTQTAAIDLAFETFATCLMEISETDLRTMVIDTFATPDTSLLDRARVAQQLSLFSTQTSSISDVAILPGSQASATITLNDGTTFIGVFSLHNGGSEATLLHIYPDIEAPVEETLTEPTSPPSAPTSIDPTYTDTSNSGSGGGGGGETDSDSSGSGSGDETEPDSIGSGGEVVDDDDAGEVEDDDGGDESGDDVDD
ncbi:MAG: hypothetical protein WKF81_10425 [Thermomicrobiales bacterium]